jgi:hypothetical protein
MQNESNPLVRLAICALIASPRTQWQFGFLRGWESGRGTHAPNGYMDLDIVWDGRVETRLFGLRSTSNPSYAEDDPRDDEVFFWLDEQDLMEIAEGKWLGEEWQIVTSDSARDLNEYTMPRTSEHL